MVRARWLVPPKRQPTSVYGGMIHTLENLEFETQTTLRRYRAYRFRDNITTMKINSQHQLRIYLRCLTSANRRESVSPYGTSCTPYITIRYIIR